MVSASDTHFRLATAADVPSLVEMETRFYANEGYPFDPAEAAALFNLLFREPERGRVWVAARGERLVGYLILTFGFSIEFHGIDALVDEVYFEPEARGLGLGTQALAVAEAECVRLGIRAIHLAVERRNTKAQALYRKIGFKDHDRFLMTKSLPPGANK